MWFFKKLQAAGWPTVLWSAIIFLLLGFRFPGQQYESSFPLPHADKLVHAGLFFIHCWLWLGYLSKAGVATLPVGARILIVVVSTIYGVALEFVQLYTGRDFDWWDMLADAAGAVTGALVPQKISPGRNRGRNQN